jgi:type IV pilus assembly protein PilA
VRRRAGFTLVEMMVILGVIAILLLMAVPSYTDKFARDQIAEALPLADLAKTPVSTSWSASQTFPKDNTEAGLPPADKIVNNFISSVSLRDGVIDVTFGSRANEAIRGKVLSLRPAVVEDAPVVPITWVCGYAEQPDKMTVKGENKTSIAPLMLPFRCRATPAKKS